MDLNITWILLLLPLAVAAINWLLLAKKGNIAALTATLSALITFALSILLLQEDAAARAAETLSFTWIPISKTASIDIGCMLDDLAIRMMVLVTGIGLLVHIFSWGYMKDDSAKGRYFAALSIFMFSMTGIVLSTNLAMTFIYWELVGFSSYLLIGHWYKKNAAADAAKKAFITNRVGDYGFLIGILIAWGMMGTLSFDNMAVPAGVPAFALAAMILCLFCGAVGKSAQFPLHVWLPDAMEGPTPVSALIHAATMVAAGVYMLVRVQTSIGVEAFAGLPSEVITAVGAITAVIAALMATQQNDIKRILAYSTLSQLGYMVMAVGVCSGEAAMFHLFTHAWFKALLFLGAGAIILACHHEQDIWKMGGLGGKMKITALCFLFGTAALIAIPGTSGFFSKEATLDAALEHNPFYFWVGAGVACLTTFYMLRLVLVVFKGRARSEQAGHAHEVAPCMTLPLILLAVMAVISGYSVVADQLVPFNGFHAHAFEPGFAFYVSLGALALGIILAVAVYGRSRDTDPLANNAISRALANRLYIDKFYDKVLIRGIQGTLATIIDFFDQFIIGGLIVQGAARIVAGIGNLVRRMQAGYLRGYAFIFGLGILFIVYLMVFSRI